MKDQVKTLQQRGVRGVRGVYSGDADEETHAQIHNGESQLAFMSPEAVLTKLERGDMLREISGICC